MMRFVRRALALRAMTTTMREAMSEATSIVAGLAQQASIEVSPSQALQLIRRSDAQRRVFVNMIQTEPSHFDEVIEAVRLLREHGHEPVPHVPAAMLRDPSDALAVLQRLSAAGARMSLIVGGNKEQGALNAMDVATLASPLFERLAFTAYPEGHPRLGSVAGDQLLDLKLARFPGSAVVTQWSADQRCVTLWLRRFCRRHIDSEVHVGVVGPAACADELARFAAKCGVRWDSGRYISLIEDARAELTALLREHPQFRLRLHLFPLDFPASMDALQSGIRDGEKGDADS